MIKGWTNKTFPIKLEWDLCVVAWTLSRGKTLPCETIAIPYCCLRSEFLLLAFSGGNSWFSLWGFSDDQSHLSLMSDLGSQVLSVSSHGLGQVPQTADWSNLLVFQAPWLLMLDDSSVSRPIVGNPKDSTICLYLEFWNLSTCVYLDFNSIQHKYSLMPTRWQVLGFTERGTNQEQIPVLPELTI